MPNDLHTYLKAEIIKKKVPVRVVNDCDRAKYIIQGTSDNRKGSWHEGWLTTEKDKATGAIEVVDQEDNLIWANEAGDRSMWFGAFKRQGARKVADRLAKKLKQAVARPRSPGNLGDKH